MEIDCNIMIISLALSGCIDDSTERQKCPSTCDDDDNPCTIDYCHETTGFECVHENFTGEMPGCSGLNDICEYQECFEGVCETILTVEDCCGNGICEEGESEYCVDCIDSEIDEPKSEETTGVVPCGDCGEPEPQPGEPVEEPTEIQSCSTGCDDGDFCTNDYCDAVAGYVCVNEEIIPCCGNGEIESGENCENCSEDIVCVGEEECLDGECILTVGCDYGEPFCAEDHLCVNNECVPKNYCLNEECESESVTFVIITRPIFLETIYEFINWKVESDFSVGVLTVDYIHSEKAESNPSKSMKTMITDFALERNTEYFLLIGDTTTAESGIEIENEWATGSERNIEGKDIQNMYDLSIPWNVPSGYICEEEYYLEGECAYSSQVTDLYFADLDNEIWQENAEGYIVIPIITFNSIENDPDYPTLDFETIIARISIRDATEFSNIFNKFKSYEPSNTLDYLLSPELGGTTEENYWCSEEVYESEEQAALSKESCREDRWIIRNLLEREGYIVDIYSFDPANLIEVQNAQNQIYHETNNVLELFHGSYDGFSIIYLEDVSNFSTVFPLLIPKSCYVGAFANPYYSETVIEKLFKQEKGPAIIASPPNQYLFFKSSIQGKTVGEAFYNPGVSNAVIVMSASNVLFGDPSLKVFSD